MGGKNRCTGGLGVLLLLCIAATQLLLLAQGRWREAIPLHLCSLSAIAALCAAAGARGAVLDFLWYLGMPGALLALLFPAPAVSRWQGLFDLAYLGTHMLIVLIPLALIRAGARPRSARTAQMMLALQGIALAAFGVNGALGTDYLFLSAPPAGTPLEAVFALGYPAYLFFLEGMMLLLCLVQSALAGALGRLADRRERG